ncbi:MAG: hypothetical protein LBM04_03540 [Opitutaceae bacterium]|jgi:hypothetical protein|nr:hypothetical protein [Opitutaceae bacterium]
MKNIRHLFLTIVAIALASGARAMPEIKKFSPADGVAFEFRDELRSPVYSWPETLLTYHVDFTGAKVLEEHLVLADAAEPGADGACLFQLSEITKASDGTLATAKVSFMSDLKPGAVRKFVLRKKTPASPATPAITRTIVTLMLDDIIEFSNGPLKVRVPGSRTFHDGAQVPAPICGLANPDAWIGSASRIVSPDKKPLRLDTECVDDGPLFITYRMTYTFANDARYIATVRLVAGYQHVDFSERMENFDPADAARVEMVWDDYAPTMRYAAHDWETLPGQPGRRIDDPIQTNGIIEEPHWFPANRIEDPSKDMLCRLAAFQGNEPRDAVPVMSFWEGDTQGAPRAGGRELSVFVPNTDGWDDGQYGIWQPTTRLQVHFRYTGNTLVWTWPLASGRRATGITLHDAAWGEQQVEKLRAIYVAEAKGCKDAFKGAWSPSIDTFRARYAQLLRSWHGMLDLDRVKDWDLTYPDSARRPPAPLPGAGNPKATPQSLEDEMFHSPLALYPLGANLAVINISHRILRPCIDDYLLMRAGMTAGQRRRIDALFLLSAYVNATDDFAPMRVCATGTPNMSADGFCAPVEINTLYPDHPMGREWREQFQKIVELQGVFFTRPDVSAWDALGGRWTESLAVYNWAYLSPVGTAQCHATEIDGQNRIATPEFAQRARWMAGELSAPICNLNPENRLKRILSGAKTEILPRGWKPGDAFSRALGFERQYAAHGAHSSGSGTVPPDHAGVLGRYLMRYDPLAAEHLLWVQAQVASRDKGEWKRVPLFAHALESVAGNTGTPPRFASGKHTGHGIILRAGGGTPEELSIHLDQIDQGPNYRWGNNGEGSSGTLYFYAGGQVWSGHERENTGDHTNDDTTGNTNFGVLKDRAYRTIGANVLDQPLYDLGVAQLAIITARAGNAPYSWPQYKSRAVQLVGTDYFLIADDAAGCGRFSWFTMKDLPFPKLVFLEPMRTRDDHWMEVTTPISHGVFRDTVRESTGSVMLVTHKKDTVEMAGLDPRPLPFLERSRIQEYRPAKGAVQMPGVYRVRTPQGEDTVFCSITPIFHDTLNDTHEKQREFFEGTNGVIRRRTDGSTEIALLKGNRIAAGGLAITTRLADGVGISATYRNPGEVTGIFFSPKDDAPVYISFPETISAGVLLYVDGKRYECEARGRGCMARLPKGRHAWQLTAGDPIPGASQIQRTVNHANGAQIHFTQAGGATTYRIETSADGCTTWIKAGETASAPYDLTGLANGKKIHVRVVAANTTHAAWPGDPYPLYVSKNPLLPPDGLMLSLSKDRVELAWGEVLGTGEYRVYRRAQGATQWEKIYAGTGRSCVDAQATGVTPPAAYPGSAANLSFTPPAPAIYEYAVACADGNGEGGKCEPVSTDPTSWRNWWPRGQERRFKRVTSYWQPPYVDAGAMPPMHYPQ